MITIKHTAGVIPKKELKKVPKDFYAKHSDGTNWVYFETKQERDDYFSNLPIAEEDEILIGAEKYDRRIIDGIAFSNIMNSRLDSFTVEGLTPDELDDIKQGIDYHYESVQNALGNGKWKTASRILAKMNANESLYIKQSTLDEIKYYVDNYVAKSYK